MTCENLEPLVTITRSYGRDYATRHRRDCGVAMRSMSAPSASGSTMNESEYEQRRHSPVRASYPIPKDHKCMERWKLHLALAEGVIF